MNRYIALLSLILLIGITGCNSGEKSSEPGTNEPGIEQTEAVTESIQTESVLEKYSAVQFSINLETCEEHKPDSQFAAFMEEPEITGIWEDTKRFLLTPIVEGANAGLEILKNKTSLYYIEIASGSPEPEIISDWILSTQTDSDNDSIQSIFTEKIAPLLSDDIKPVTGSTPLGEYGGIGNEEKGLYYMLTEGELLVSRNLKLFESLSSLINDGTKTDMVEDFESKKSDWIHAPISAFMDFKSIIPDMGPRIRRESQNLSPLQKFAYNWSNKGYDYMAGSYSWENGSVKTNVFLHCSNPDSASVVVNPGAQTTSIGLMGHYPAQTLFIANITEPLFDILEKDKWTDKLEMREMVIGLIPDPESTDLGVLVTLIPQSQIDLPSMISSWFPESNPVYLVISGKPAIKVVSEDEWMGPVSDATETYFAVDNDLLLIASSENAISEWWSDSPRIIETPGFTGYSSELPENGIPIGYGSAGIANWLVSSKEEDSNIGNVCRILYDYMGDIGIYQLIRPDGVEFQALSKSDLSVAAEIAILASLSWQPDNDSNSEPSGKRMKRKHKRNKTKDETSGNVMKGKRFQIEQ